MTKLNSDAQQTADTKQKKRLPKTGNAFSLWCDAAPTFRRNVDTISIKKGCQNLTTFFLCGVRRLRTFGGTADTVYKTKTILNL